MHGNVQDLIFLIGVVIIYNLATIALLKVTLAQVNVREAALEKAVTAAPVAAETAGTGAPADAETSYSRVTGLVGMIVMACFLWALGNVIIYMVLTGQTSKISGMISDISTFFLAGASLFAPYAFNQLQQAFK